MVRGVEWWPLVIGVLWKTKREDRDEKTERKISVMKRENENKIIIYIMQLLSVLSQI